MTINSIYYRLLNLLGYEHKYGKVLPFHHAKVKEVYAGKKILSDQAANNLIGEKIKEGRPFLVSRLGNSELGTIYNYHLYNGRNIKWDEGVIKNICINAGFFPQTENGLAEFAKINLEAIASVDIMGVWFNEGEETICGTYCPGARFIQLKAIEPYYHTNPWSQFLKGKKVLVIHPFEDSILYQYHHTRTKLFTDPLVLPEFELRTIKAVQSISNNQTGFNSWFEALAFMKQQVQQTDFDIAIIGAGAYGLPLGAFVKQIGKQAIHMGGATQILFGIKGKRWELNKEVAEFFNDWWKKPFEHEVPVDAIKVEEGCYW